jgi:hypothetical protein
MQDRAKTCEVWELPFREIGVNQPTTHLERARAGHLPLGGLSKAPSWRQVNATNAFPCGKLAMTEREVFLKIRQELTEANKVWREAINAEYRAHMAFEAANRRMEDLQTRLGPQRPLQIAIGG